MPRIIAQTADFAGQIFELAEPTVSVGRSAQNQIHLPHTSVSGKHAQFRLDGLDYAVKDVGSTNGTRVNGDRITSEVKLRRNDSLSFGNLEFIYDSEHVPPGQPLPELAPQIDLQACISRGKPATFINAMPKAKSQAGTMAWLMGFIALWILYVGSMAYYIYVLQLPPSTGS